MKLANIFWVILILLSCVENKKDIQNIQTTEHEISEIDLNNNRQIIENYFVNEILNGIKFNGKINDKNSVIAIYGVPLEENMVSIAPFDFEGNNVIAIRNIIYDDLLHYYYVFETGSELYAGIEINKPLKRIKTINIGDNINKLKSAFGNNFYQYKNTISYYGLDEEVLFFIENDIIVKIVGNYLLI